MNSTTVAEDVHTGYIYGLFASDRPILLWECRYVGKTLQSLQKRLNGHRSEIARGTQSKRCSWIKSVHSRGATIEIRALESHAASDKVMLNGVLIAREMIWIASGRQQDWDLTNGTDGGDGGLLGFRHTEESKAKMSASSVGYIPSPETIEKIRITSTGRKHTPETRAKISASNMGKTHSPETLALFSMQRTGRRHTSEALFEYPSRRLRTKLPAHY